MEIKASTKGILAAMENKKAVRAEVLTAGKSWLPEEYGCKNLKYDFILDGYEDKAIPVQQSPQLIGQNY